ncbi:hypothetical protein GCM10028895_25120 [Pontibacter rugosus]
MIYQHDNGGWDKNTDMAIALSPEEEQELKSPAVKAGISTIDNRATFTQLEYLAKVYAATGQAKYKESFCADWITCWRRSTTMVAGRSFTQLRKAIMSTSRSMMVL